MNPLLLVLSAPSGTGKTTLARRLRDALPDARFSVSYTTRAPRGKERDGVDYYFVSPERFAELVRQGRFVEWALVHGHQYGTPREPIERALREGDLLVFDIDVQGGEAIKKAYPGAVRVLVVPPSVDELERRLRARSTDDDATIRRRLEVARKEIERAKELGYEHEIVNDDLDRAFAELLGLVRAKRAPREP